MNESFSHLWPMLALRGGIAILFGVLALLWPGLTLLSLVALFAAYTLFGGVAALYGAITNRKNDAEWWLLLILGLVSIGAAIIAILHPALTALVLVLLMGANALLTGVLDIAVAVRMRRVIRNEWMLIVSGAVSIVFGILVFLYPDAGALALIWIISFYALVTGALLLALAFRLQKTAGQPGEDRRSSSHRRVEPDRRIAGHHP